MPVLIMCPNYELTNEGKLWAESQLPPMKYLWDSWEKIRKNQPIINVSLPWSNEEPTIQKFFYMVMFEGGLLASKTCESMIRECSDKQYIFSDHGICFKMNQGV